jgi:plasmid stabilization system protein ParE
MTVAVRIAVRARDWIRGEADYLRRERPDAAQAFRQAMHEAAELLSEQSHAGVRGLIPETRVLVKGDYLLSYRLVHERDHNTVRAVEIFAVRHGRQRDARQPES